MSYHGLKCAESRDPRVALGHTCGDSPFCQELKCAKTRRDAGVCTRVAKVLPRTKMRDQPRTRDPLGTRGARHVR